jgi:hypothetical protein
MLELYRSELSRFRNSAAIYGIANLLTLAVLQPLIDLPSAPLGFHGVMLVFYMLSGLGFALFQFGTYRKPGRWIWLLHRPVQRVRLLATLALAALTLIALAVALPLFILLATQEHYTRHVIDARHYAGAAYLALSALSAWLAGGYIVLHRSRWAFVVLLLPVALTMYLATAATVLELSVACNALLLFLLYTVFRPNRYAGDDAAATLGSAIPLQVCLYLGLLWSGSMLFQAGQMVAGVHPQATDNIPPGSHAEVMRVLPADAIRAGLAHSADPRAAAWKTILTRQYTPSGGREAHLNIVRQHMVRHALTTSSMARFADGESLWTFSHDRMMYRGVNPRTRADLGWLGAGSAASPFDSPPAVRHSFSGGTYLVNAHDIYQAGPGKGLRHLLHVDGAEQLRSSPAELGRQTLVLTNRRLVVLDQALAMATELPLQDVSPSLFAGDLDRVDAVQVDEGLLVSLVYGARLLEGVSSAPQVVFLIDAAGQAHEVARRELAHDFPLLFEHKDWWLSPPLHALAALPGLLVDNGVPPDAGASRFAPLLRARPAAAWAAAIVAALLSGAGAAWWMRRVRVTPRARIAWCAACLVLGLPALLSLMVLRPREQAAGAVAPSAVRA